MQEECFQELFPWYYAAMEQMVFVGFKIPEELREKTRAAAETLNESEGQFIRAAIVEKLEKMGVPMERNYVRPPSRRGIGGFPTHKRNRPPEPAPALLLNDAPSSAPATSIEAHAAMAPAPVTYRRKASRGAARKAASPSESAPAPAPRLPPAKAPPRRPATPVPTSRENPT